MKKTTESLAQKIEKTLSDSIRTRREAAGWTQEDLAEKAGMSTNAVTLIENRKRWPRPESLAALIEALNMSILEAFGYEAPAEVPWTESAELLRAEITRLSSQIQAMPAKISEALPHLTPDEEQWLAIYRAADPEDRSDMMKTARHFLEPLSSPESTERSEVPAAPSKKARSDR